MGRAKGILVNDAFSSLLGTRRGSQRTDDLADHQLHHKTLLNSKKIKSETSWRLWKDGPLHREDGPALIVSNKDALLDETDWSLANTPIIKLFYSVNGDALDKEARF
jgi:hypothetical protein